MKKITKEMMMDFKKYLFEEEKSDNTIKKYMRDICAFCGWLGNKNVEKTMVLAYKKELCEKYLPVSVNSMLSSLNALFTFLNWNEMKVKTIKIQRRIFSEKEKELTKEEYERLLLAAKEKKNERLYYLMQTIAATGIRISELKYITVASVNVEKATIRSKGKIRQVFLPKQLCRMLKEYMKQQQIKTGSIFITRNGTPLDRSTIWKMMKALCEEARVSKSKVFPHNFRHLFARTYYSLQKDIVRLADILGHSNINTTRIYTMENGEAHTKQLQMLGLLRC